MIFIFGIVFESNLEGLEKTFFKVILSSNFEVNFKISSYCSSTSIWIFKLNLKILIYEFY